MYKKIKYNSLIIIILFLIISTNSYSSDSTSEEPLNADVLALLSSTAQSNDGESFRDIKEKEGFIVDIRKLIKKAKSKIQKVNVKLEGQAQYRRNIQREEKLREYYSKAMRLYDEGKYSEAQELWEKSIMISEHPEMKDYLSSSIKKSKKLNKSLEKEEDRMLSRLEKERGYDAGRVKALYKDAVKDFKKEKYIDSKLKFEEVDSMFPDFKAVKSYLMLIERKIFDEQQKLIAFKLKQEEVASKKEKELWRKQISVKEMKRREKLELQAEKVYKDALQLYRMYQLDEAKKKFQEVEWILPDYALTSKYLVRIDKDLKAENDKLEKERSKAFDSQLAGLEKSKEYQDEARLKALEKKEREWLFRVEEEANFVYGSAVSLFENGDYFQSKDRFLEVQELYPEYRQTDKYLVKIEKELSKEEIKYLKKSRELGEDNPEMIFIKNTKGRIRTLKEEEWERRLKDEAGVLYKAAVSLYKKKYYLQARDKFLEVDALYPAYSATKTYLKKANNILAKAESKRMKLQEKALVKFMEEERSAKLHAEGVMRKEKEDREKYREKIKGREAEIIYNSAVLSYKKRFFELSKVKFQEVEAVYPDYKDTRKYLKGLGIEVVQQEEIVKIESKKKSKKRKSTKIAKEKSNEQREVLRFSVDSEVIELVEKEFKDPVMKAVYERKQRILKEAGLKYKKALKLYDSGLMDQAKIKFIELESFYPGFKNTLGYLERIESGLSNERLEASEELVATEVYESKKVCKKGSMTKNVESLVGEIQGTEEVHQVYLSAVSLYKKNNLRLAQVKFLAVNKLSPDYKSTEKYLKRIDKKILRSYKKSEPILLKSESHKILDISYENADKLIGKSISEEKIKEASLKNYAYIKEREQEAEEEKEKKVKDYYKTQKELKKAVSSEEKTRIRLEKKLHRQAKRQYKIRKKERLAKEKKEQKLLLVEKKKIDKVGVKLFKDKRNKETLEAQLKEKNLNDLIAEKKKINQQIESLVKDTSEQEQIEIEKQKIIDKKIKKIVNEAQNKDGIEIEKQKIIGKKRALIRKEAKDQEQIEIEKQKVIDKKIEILAERSIEEERRQIEKQKKIDEKIARLAKKAELKEQKRIKRQKFIEQKREHAYEKSISEEAMKEQAALEKKEAAVEDLNKMKTHGTLLSKKKQKEFKKQRNKISNILEKEMKSDKEKREDQLRALYIDAVHLYKQNKYYEARAKFKYIDGLKPGFKGAKVYVKRCDNWLARVERIKKKEFERRKSQDIKMLKAELKEVRSKLDEKIDNSEKLKLEQKKLAMRQKSKKDKDEIKKVEGLSKVELEKKRNAKLKEEKRLLKLRNEELVSERKKRIKILNEEKRKEELARVKEDKINREKNKKEELAKAEEAKIINEQKRRQELNRSRELKRINKEKKKQEIASRKDEKKRLKEAKIKAKELNKQKKSRQAKIKKELELIYKEAIKLVDSKQYEPAKNKISKFSNKLVNKDLDEQYLTYARLRVINLRDKIESLEEKEKDSNELIARKRELYEQRKQQEHENKKQRELAKLEKKVKEEERRLEAERQKEERRIEREEEENLKFTRLHERKIAVEKERLANEEKKRLANQERIIRQEEARQSRIRLQEEKRIEREDRKIEQAAKKEQMKRLVKIRKDELKREREDVRKEFEDSISSLYDKAVRLYKIKDYNPSLEIFRTIDDMRPNYKKTSGYVKKITKILTKFKTFSRNTITKNNTLYKMDSIKTSNLFVDRKDIIANALDLVENEI